MVIIIARRRRQTWEGVPMANLCIQVRMRGELDPRSHDFGCVIINSPADAAALLSDPRKNERRKERKKVCARPTTEPVRGGAAVGRAPTIQWLVLCQILRFPQFSIFCGHYSRDPSLPFMVAFTIRFLCRGCEFRVFGAKILKKIGDVWIVLGIHFSPLHQLFHMFSAKSRDLAPKSKMRGLVCSADLWDTFCSHSHTTQLTIPHIWRHHSKLGDLCEARVSLKLSRQRFGTVAWVLND